MTENWPDFFRQNAGQPETMAEAVDRLMAIIDDEQKTAIAAMREEELTNLHFRNR